MSKGHIRARGKSWEIRYPLPPGPDGKRRVETRTVHGSKRDAQRALREAMGVVDRGEHVENSKAKVGEYVRSRIEQWRRAEQISPRTAERYNELLDLYIVPHLGSVALQKLTTAAVEKWHTDLRTAGRKDGKGGLCTRTVRHAHRLLVRAIGDAMRHNLVVRNVAQAQKPPRGESDDEVEIMAADQIAPMLAKLEGDPFYVPAVVALYVGLRRSEQLALKFSSHVDLDGKVIRVREAIEETVKGGIRIKQPKTKAGRRDVSLPDVVVAALREHRRQQLELRMALGLGKPDDDALVFPGDDGGYQSRGRSRPAGGALWPAWSFQMSPGMRCATRTHRC